MEQNKVSFQNPKTGEPLSQQEIDEMFMRRCLQLAKNGRQNAKPNPMVGAVINIINNAMNTKVKL